MMMDIKNPFYSVTELNLLAKGVLESASELSFISVRGEIASYKEYPNAIYFDLKDEKSLLTCVLWGSSFQKVSFNPKIGDEVIAYGSVSLYAQKGRYQFVASSLSLYGKGEALLALEALKRKLEEEGLFDISKKKKIPPFPSSIGIVVGKGSAAEADLKTNILRRWPLTKLYVYHALVQGKKAPEDIIRALKESEKDDLDVLILARGGGSHDDLDAFNDESLVRAFYEVKVPKIAAVGHEIDFTLVDYVADRRVSTPTGAAELASPDQNEVYISLSERSSTLISSLKGKIEKEEARLTSLSKRKFFLDPSSIYAEAEETLLNKNERLLIGMKNLLERKENALSLKERSLEGLDHQALLKRGYSVTLKEDGSIIRSMDDVQKGERIKTLLIDGCLISKLEEKENGKED